MNKSLVLAVCAATIGMLALSSPVSAAKYDPQCEKEWKAKRAADKNFKDLLKDTCKDLSAKPAAATPAAAPAQPAAPAAAAPKQAPAPAAPAAAAPKSSPAATTAPTGANQFTTEALAKVRCPTDTIVWVNLSSKIYHFTGHKEYGHTKRGAYMCEKDTAAAGARAAKDEKHP